MNRLAHMVWQLPRRVLVATTRVYQWTLSPLVGRHCRFQPTCSNYFIQSVESTGPFGGPAGHHPHLPAAIRLRPAVTIRRKDGENEFVIRNCLTAAPNC